MRLMRLFFLALIVWTIELHVPLLTAIVAVPTKSIATTASTSATSATSGHTPSASGTTPTLHNASATTAVFACPVALELVLQ